MLGATGLRDAGRRPLCVAAGQRSGVRGGLRSRGLLRWTRTRSPRTAVPAPRSRVSGALGGHGPPSRPWRRGASVSMRQKLGQASTSGWGSRSSTRSRVGSSRSRDAPQPPPPSARRPFHDRRAASRVRPPGLARSLGNVTGPPQRCRLDHFWSYCDHGYRVRRRAQVQTQSLPPGGAGGSILHRAQPRHPRRHPRATRAPRGGRLRDHRADGGPGSVGAGRSPAARPGHRCRSAVASKTATDRDARLDELISGDREPEDSEHQE